MHRHVTVDDGRRTNSNTVRAASRRCAHVESQGSPNGVRMCLTIFPFRQLLWFSHCFVAPFGVFSIYRILSTPDRYFLLFIFGVPGSVQWTGPGRTTKRTVDQSHLRLFSLGTNSFNYLIIFEIQRYKALLKILVAGICLRLDDRYDTHELRFISQPCLAFFFFLC